MKKTLPPILLLIITILYFAPVIFSHNTFISRDIYIFYNPKHFFSAETIKEGVLPLWNPYLAGGVPFQANVQSCIFYPLSLIFYLLPFQTGYKYFVLIHYFLATLSMYLLMRQWRASVYGALVASIVFAFGGYMVSILDNVCFLTAAVWLPFILLFHHRALQSGSYFYSCITAGCIALQVFAGDLSFYVLTTGMSLLLYTLFWPMIKTTPSRPCAPLTPWLQLLCALVLGYLMAAVQIIPMIELAVNSTRFTGFTYETVTKWSYHPLEFLQLLIPALFGSIVPQTRWFGQLWLDTFYMGIFALPLALFFIIYSREKIRFFFIALLACSLFLSTGQYNPLFKFAYQGLPVLHMLQYPVKFLFAGAFCLAVMAGMGSMLFFDRVAQGNTLKGYVNVLALFLLVLLAALMLGAWFQDGLYRYFLSRYPQVEYFQKIEKPSFFAMYYGLSMATILSAIFFVLIAFILKGTLRPLAGKCIMISVLFLDLVFIGKPREPYLPEATLTQKNATVNFLNQDTSQYRIFSLSNITHQKSFMHSYLSPFAPLYAFFQEELPPNLNIYHRIPSADEYADMPQRAYFQLLSPVPNCFEKKGASRTDARVPINILNLLNVKYIISAASLDNPHFKLVQEGRVKIYENPGCLPRAFFAEQLLLVESEENVLGKMNDPLFDPAKMVYVSKQEIAKLRGDFIAEPESEARKPFSGTIAFTGYGINTVSMTTQSNKARFLVLADNYYPGWKAYVNGKERPVLRVDYTLRGLLLEKGRNAITFVFRPQSFFWGAGLSILTLLGLLAALFRLRYAQCNCPLPEQREGISGQTLKAE